MGDGNDNRAERRHHKTVWRASPQNGVEATPKFALNNSNYLCTKYAKKMLSEQLSERYGGSSDSERRCSDVIRMENGWKTFHSCFPIWRKQQTGSLFMPIVSLHVRCWPSHSSKVRQECTYSMHKGDNLLRSLGEGRDTQRKTSY